MNKEQNINQLPKDWKWVKLGEYVKSVKGKKPKSISKEKTNSHSIPYVNIKAFEQGIIDEYTNGQGCVLCENGDFLMVWDGSRSGYVGKGIKGALGSTLVKLDFPNIDNNYAYYFLQSKFLDINTRAKGVGIPHVDPNILWNYNLLIPPLSTQTAIVAKIEELFSALDKGIEQLKTAQQQLKTYRQAVLKWAFEGKLTRSLNHDSYDLHDEQDLSMAAEPAAEYKTQKNQDNQENPINHGSDNGKLPEGWKWVKLGDVSKVSGGLSKTPKRHNLEMQMPFLRVANVYFNSLDLSEIHTIGVTRNEIERVRLEKDDLLFVEGNGSIEQIGRVALWNGSIQNCVHQNHLIKSRLSREIIPKYSLYFFCSKAGRNNIKKEASSTSGLHTLSLGKISKLELPLCSLKEQNKIVQAIESRLSVADKMEESITQSLQQAEALRQSILKKAFEGRLINTTAKVVAFKPKNQYFFDCQILGYIIRSSKKKNIRHGEMTLAKYAYLAVKIFGIPLSYIFQQWHLGPYPPEIKKAVNNKQFFLHTKSGLDLADEEKLLKYENPYLEQTEQAVNELIAIFEKYDAKNRAHKTELLATVCKVIEDTVSTDFSIVREAMRNWKIALKNSPYKNKAEKFNEEETKQCLSFIIKRGWGNKLTQQHLNDQHQEI